MIRDRSYGHGTGRHIGRLPHDPVTRAKQERLRSLGFSTIDRRSYNLLVAAGIEPDQYDSIPSDPDELERYLSILELV